MRHIFLQRGIVWLLTGLLLSACASNIPSEINVVPPGDPSPDQVIDQPADFATWAVRWGGTLISIENRDNATWLTVLALPLGNDGSPKDSDDSLGRFIAIVPGFLDPKVYTPDRRITVTGTVLRTETRNVGDFPYTYPVIQAEAYYLWPVETEPYYNDWYPYYPWYSPWPYHSYPLGHPHRY